MNAQRQEFLTRCMNAAVNLYGAVSFEEMIMLYNRYASDKPSPVSDLLVPDEIDSILALPEPDDFDLDSEEIWFGHGEIDGKRYLVQKQSYYGSNADGSSSIDEQGLREQLDGFAVPMLRILSEEDFLLHEEPMAHEETAVTKLFAKFLCREYDFNRDDVWLSVWDLQCELRMSASMPVALISARNTLGIEVADEAELDDLIDALIPIVRNTRAWNYRGYTETELVDDGLVDDFKPIDGGMGYDAYMHDLCGDENPKGNRDDYPDDHADDWEPDAWDTGHLSDEELAEILPPAEYPKEPVDFKFVKDADRREKVLADYENVRNVTVDFVREVLMKRLSDKARSAARRRLGFPVDGDRYDPIDRTLDMIAGDYASMLDDQKGTPLIRQVLADIGKLDKYHQLGAAYYRNYRYSWLVVQAVKAGVGLKCRNLMTGEDLFLMETSYSRGADLKGSLICAGIAPMGSVYLCLGTLHPANFDPPEAVFKIIRQKLGLPLDGPLDLSPADEAEFAAETIRRLYSLGKFSNIVY